MVLREVFSKRCSGWCGRGLEEHGRLRDCLLDERGKRGNGTRLERWQRSAFCDQEILGVTRPLLRFARQQAVGAALLREMDTHGTVHDGK